MDRKERPPLSPLNVNCEPDYRRCLMTPRDGYSMAGGHIECSSVERSPVLRSTAMRLTADDLRREVIHGNHILATSNQGDENEPARWDVHGKPLQSYPLNSTVFFNLDETPKSSSSEDRRRHLCVQQIETPLMHGALSPALQYRFQSISSIKPDQQDGVYGESPLGKTALAMRSIPMATFESVASTPNMASSISSTAPDSGSVRTRQFMAQLQYRKFVTVPAELFHVAGSDHSYIDDSPLHHCAKVASFMHPGNYRSPIHCDPSTEVFEETSRAYFERQASANLLSPPDAARRIAEAALLELGATQEAIQAHLATMGKPAEGSCASSSVDAQVQTDISLSAHSDYDIRQFRRSSGRRRLDFATLRNQSFPPALSPTAKRAKAAFTRCLSSPNFPLDAVSITPTADAAQQPCGLCDPEPDATFLSSRFDRSEDSDSTAEGDTDWSGQRRSSLLWMGGDQLAALDALSPIRLVGVGDQWSARRGDYSHYRSAASLQDAEYASSSSASIGDVDELRSADGDAGRSFRRCFPELSPILPGAQRPPPHLDATPVLLAEPSGGSRRSVVESDAGLSQLDAAVGRATKSAFGALALSPIGDSSHISVSQLGADLSMERIRGCVRDDGDNSWLGPHCARVSLFRDAFAERLSPPRRALLAAPPAIKLSGVCSSTMIDCRPTALGDLPAVTGSFEKTSGYCSYPEHEHLPSSFVCR